MRQAKVSSRWLPLLAAIVAIAQPGRAAVPGEVQYQGLLLDDLGQPVTETVSMGFALYDAVTGGTMLWSESHPAVGVVDGVYEVTLGSVTPIDAALVAGGSLYLEVSVEAEVLTPRQALLVVPYALRSAVAEDAERLVGVDGAFLAEMVKNISFDGADPPNQDPREGVSDVDGDGLANFMDPDNDGDGLSDEDELAAASDINLVTPSLTGFAPATADGFVASTVQVQGTSFEPGMSVSFGTQNPTPTNLTPTSFDVLVGPQPAGDATVIVTRLNGESAQATFPFFLFEPVLTSISPAVLIFGQGGTLTVHGADFVDGLVVDFGSQSPTPFNVTPSQFDITVAGSEPVGFVEVTITLPNGNFVTSPDSFRVADDKVVFLTSTEQTGSMGGLAAADAICNSLAQAAALPGTFQAWLADSTGSPATRSTQHTGPYVRTDGVIVASDWSGLIVGILDAGISVDESGIARPGSTAWTNVQPETAAMESDDHCLDWTNQQSALGRYGLASQTGEQWTSFDALGCSFSRRLYCIEQ